MARSATGRRSAGNARAATQRKRRNRIWLTGLGGLALVSVAAAITVFVVSNFSNFTNSGSGDSRANGAPNFSFTLFQGQDELGAESLDMDQLRGRPVVLNFWAGQCPPCRAEMPDLQRFYEDFKGRVTLLGVDVGQFTGLGTRSDAKNLLRELRITYPAGFTKDGSVTRKYEVLSMPTTVFINSEGEIFETWSGALNQDILERVTTAMLNESQRNQPSKPAAATGS